MPAAETSLGFLIAGWLQCAFCRMYEILQKSNHPFQFLLRNWMSRRRSGDDDARAVNHVTTQLDVLVKTIAY